MCASFKQGLKKSVGLSGSDTPVLPPEVLPRGRNIYCVSMIICFLQQILFSKLFLVKLVECFFQLDIQLFL